MRRKSERNKAKASPDKKVEKPTRKSTRRRAKKSPSTSPERENSNDADAVQGNEKESLLLKIQTRLHSKESENVVDEPETKVSSTETITKQQEVDDSGSVWKAARADASPGEIPKLKLCRQRNLSETSDVSLSRKRTNKWQEGGEGFVEEADSADEKPATSLSTDVGDEPADNPSSTIPGRDSGEEVSDSKEFPPENASADLSDDKPNIDQQDDTNETSNCTTSIVDNQPNTPEPLESTDTKTIVDADDAKGQQKENESNDTNDRTIEQNVKSPVENTVEEEQKEPEVTKKSSTSSEDEQDNNKSVQQSGSSENSNDESNENEEEKEKEREKEREKEKEKEKETVRVSVRTSRRKHRDKYQDSSNSDSADSDDEPTRTTEKPIEIETPTEQKSPIAQEIPETTDRSSETELVLSHQTDSIIETDNDEALNNSQKSILTEKVDQITSVDQIQSSKSAKVNLKRSFTSRVSTDIVEKRTNANENDTIQEKENHVSSDQVDPLTIPKKRRWGTVTSTDTTPAYSISTDSLKVLVPGAKPLSISEVRLSKDDEEDRERRKDREKRYSVASIPEDKGKDDNDSMKTETTRRKISIVKDTSTKSPSPIPAQPTNILLIKNLVRPFTLNQIKELLSRTGVIVENGFWMDRIKSKCYVEYSNEDQAFETRQALHGISWPLSNPKKLQVEYATKEDMEQARELSKDQISSRKTEAIASTDMWQQDWIRDEKVNSNTKVTIVREWDLGKEDGQHLLRDKEREKKDIDKKRRQRSRSPALDTHLPAPARKFKKKEDEPPPAKLLDDLFRKTKATPCIYWLPLTNEQIVVKEEMRRQHMAEHARQLEEMRRAERNRDNRRRRSPRK